MPKCISGHLNVKVKLRGEGLLVVVYSRIVFLRNYSLKSHHQRVHMSLSIKGNIHCVTPDTRVKRSTTRFDVVWYKLFM